MSNHPNRSKRNPGAGRNPEPAEIIAAREKAGLTQRAAAEKVYSAEGAWQNWEQGQRPMHPAFFELFLLKTGQSSLGRIAPGTIDHRGTYKV